MSAPLIWPDKKRFAFTIFDDADKDVLDNTKPVYDFLHDLGVHTTKSVWTLAGTEKGTLDGLTCEDPRYLAWAKSLQQQGFEIGFHNARFHSSRRADTQRALELFRAHFGHYPRSMANHFQNKESIYWGSARMSGVHRLVYNLSNVRRLKSLQCEGHVPDSPYFWGDLCRDKIEYVRNFVFREINTLKMCPFLPYHDPLRPYVNQWYASAEGGHVGSFVETIREENQDQLVAEGGACIMYAHLAKNFWVDGKLDPLFKKRMERLAGLGGWFVPLAELLDYIRKQRGGDHTITAGERWQLQQRWLVSKLRHGSS